MTESALIRMRLILVVLASALLYGQRIIAGFVRLSHVGGHREDLRPILHGLDGILFLAAVIVLAFSFIRIKRNAGELCYDPANPYWRVMKWAYGDDWGERVSLCKSYWLTVWLLFVPAFGVTLLTLFGIFAVPDILREVIANPYGTFKICLLVIGTLMMCAAFAAFCAWLSTKVPWLKYLWGTLLGGLFATLTIVGLFVVPIGDIAEKRKITVAAAVGVYSEYVALILACAAGLIGLIWAAFKFLPWLRNTWLGQLLATFKDKMCPTLAACPCGSGEAK